MSANAMPRSFAIDYVTEPRRRKLGVRLPMVAMTVVLLAALTATFLPGPIAVGTQEDAISTILLGP